MYVAAGDQQPACEDGEKVTLRLGIGYEPGESLSMVKLAELLPTLHAKDVGMDRSERDQMTECTRLTVLKSVDIAPSQAPRVIVIVGGGLVQSIFADRPLNVDVLDHDNWECTDRASDPQEWLRFEALAEEIDEGGSLERVY